VLPSCIHMHKYFSMDTYICQQNIMNDLNYSFFWLEFQLVLVYKVVKIAGL